MSRSAIRSQRKEAQERWPTLSNDLGAYFSQDFVLIDGSIEGALDRMVSDYPLDHRQSLLKEWREANVNIAWKPGFERYLGDVFGVALPFDDHVDARRFWNRFHDRIIESVRSETAKPRL